MSFPNQLKSQARALQLSVVQPREVRYEYQAQTRGSVTATPEHKRGLIPFRLLNTSGFEVVQASLPVVRVTHNELDGLAKRTVGQPSAFI